MPWVANQARPVEECDGGDGLLVGQCFGVGQPTESVNGGVEIDVAAAFGLPLRLFGLLGLGASATVDPPAAAVGDPVDLLHIHVSHVARPPRGDLAGFAICVAVRVDESTMVEPERCQVATYRASADRCLLSLQLERDPRSGPLVGATHLLDPRGHVTGGRAGPALGGRGSVMQADFAVAAPPVDPLAWRRRGRRPSLRRRERSDESCNARRAVDDPR